MNGLLTFTLKPTYLKPVEFSALTSDSPSAAATACASAAFIFSHGEEDGGVIFIQVERREQLSAVFPVEGCVRVWHTRTSHITRDTEH